MGKTNPPAGVLIQPGMTVLWLVTALSALLLIVGLVPAALSGLTLPYRILWAAFLLIFVPGACLAAGAGPWFALDRGTRAVWYQVFTWFVYGFTFLCLYSSAAYLFNISLTAYITGYGAALLVLLAASVLIARFRSAPVSSSRPRVYETLALSIVLFIIAAAAFHFGGWISGDAIIHLPKIRQIFALNIIDYNNIFIKDLAVEVRGYSPLYPFLAAVSRLAGADPMEAWAVVPVVFAVMRVVIFFYATRVLFNNYAFAVLSTGILLLAETVFNLHAGMGVSTPHWMLSGRFPNPTPFELIFSPLILAGVADYARHPRVRAGILLAAVGLAYALIHTYFFLVTLFVAGLIVCAIAIKEGVKGATTWNGARSLAWLAPGLMYAAYLQHQITSPAIVNPSFMSAVGNPGYYPIIHIMKFWPVVDPFTGLWRGPFQVAACVGSVIAAVSLRGRWEMWLLFLPFGVIAFLLLNPLFLKAVEPLDPSFQSFYRLREGLPYVWMLSGGVYAVARFIKAQWGRTWLAAAAVLSAVLMASPVAAALRSVREIPYTVEQTFQFYRQNLGFYQQFARVIPAGSVVLMDPRQEWYWPVFLPHFMVTHPNQNLLPPNFDPRPREEGIQKFLAGEDIDGAEAFLRQSRVDYCVIQANLPANRVWSARPGMARRAEIMGFTVYARVPDTARKEPL